jgi:hypothetical protein
VTLDDFNSHEYLRLHFTSETLTWDPTTTLYEEQETAMTDYSGKLVHDSGTRGPPQTLILNVLQSLTTDLADVMHDCDFHWVLTSYIVISSVDVSLTGQVRMHKMVPIDFKTLAAWWMVSLERAQQTVQQAIQQGICTCCNPMLAWQFPINDQMFCFKQLSHTMFTDMFFAGIPSCGGNKCSQAYRASFGWARAHPMTIKGEAHETLLPLLFQCNGVPPTMVFTV